MKNDEGKLSRRKFLEAAVVTAAVSSSVSAEPAPDEDERRRLEELIERYGSELGDLRRVR